MKVFHSVFNPICQRILHNFPDQGLDSFLSLPVNSQVVLVLWHLIFSSDPLFVDQMNGRIQFLNIFSPAFTFFLTAKFPSAFFQLYHSLRMSRLDHSNHLLIGLSTAVSIFSALFVFPLLTNHSPKVYSCLLLFEDSIEH